MGGTLTWGSWIPVQREYCRKAWKAMTRGRRSLTRCWVLRDRVTDCSAGTRLTEPLDIEQAVDQADSRPNFENCIVDASIFND